MTELKKEKNYKKLIQDLGGILEQGRKEAYKSVNKILVKTYWGIGKRIVEFEQGAKKRADYGAKLIDKLYKDLKQKYGKGFSRGNVYAMRQFYLCFPNFPDTSGKLTWSHFVEYALGGVSNQLFVSRYQLYLPNKIELEREVKKLL